MGEGNVLLNNQKKSCIYELLKLLRSISICFGLNSSELHFLLFLSGWISRSDSQTVVVQPGKNATLLCSNFSSFPTHTIWFRLVNQTSPICISSIYNFAQPSVLCNGIEHEKVELTSNISTIFLKIKQVDLSDSGLYFCGYYTNGHPVIVNSTYLKVQGKNDVTFHMRVNHRKQMCVLHQYSQIVMQYCEELGSHLKNLFSFCTKCVIQVKCGHFSCRRS